MGLSPKSFPLPELIPTAEKVAAEILRAAPSDHSCSQGSNYKRVKCYIGGGRKHPVSRAACHV